MAEINFWSDQSSVLFTSFWGWEPHHWGTVGWTGDRGRTRRDNLLEQFTDPFITVVYVTNGRSFIDPTLRGMFAGFYLLSHETGDRNEFVHPRFHEREPTKWRHSVRAIRAFSYLPETRLSVREFDETVLHRAQFVASMGEVLDDRRQIARLRNTPWVEVDVYRGGKEVDDLPRRGQVRAGPENEDGYEVSPTAAKLGRQLYVLRMEGGTESYLGRPCDGRAIYKVGMSVSPDLRRQHFQKSMPHGIFRWHVDRTTGSAGYASFDTFEAAVVGEDAMKRHLASCADWLGGEFYLATPREIDEAWELGHSAVQTFRGKK